MKYLLLFQNLSPQLIITFILGCVVYFFLEYKTKKDDVGFQLAYWVKSNWHNVIISLAFMFVYLLNTPEPEAWIVFVMGACPNYVIDRVQGLIAKYTKKD